MISLGSPLARKAIAMFENDASYVAVAKETGLKLSTLYYYRHIWRRQTGRCPDSRVPRSEADIREDLRALLYAAFERHPEEFRR